MRQHGRSARSAPSAGTTWRPPLMPAPPPRGDGTQDRLRARGTTCARPRWTRQPARPHASNRPDPCHSPAHGACRAGLCPHAAIGRFAISGRYRRPLSAYDAALCAATMPPSCLQTSPPIAPLGTCRHFAAAARGRSPAIYHACAANSCRGRDI